MARFVHDNSLLADYVRTRSREAFGRLVERYVDLVYAAARRQVHRVDLADDVTQAVFIIFAKKAAGLSAGSLAGWFFNTTRYCAANANRTERRRERHERRAARQEVHMPADEAETSELAGQLQKMLDTALAHLPGRDREVVLLRYLQNREFADVSALLGISEGAARKRLTRAIERLRRYFASQGSTVAPALMAGALDSAARHLAPAHLAATVTATAVGQASAGAIAASLVTKTVHAMAWAKAKVAAVVLIGSTLVISGGTMVVKTVLAQETARPAAALASQPVAASEKVFATTFADGMRVELLGIGPNPSTGKSWWRADGSALAVAPYDHLGAKAFPSAGEQAYEFAARITNRPQEPIAWEWDIGGRGGGAGGTGSTADGHSAPDNAAVAKALPAGKPTTVRLRIAAGPWRTRAESEGGGMTSAQEAGNAVSIAPVVDTRDGAFVSISDTYVELDSQVIVIDVNGRTVRSGGSSTGSSGRLRLKTATFPRTRAQIKQVQFQTRPFDRWVEFANVSLTPGTTTRVVVQSSDTATPNLQARFANGSSVEIVAIGADGGVAWWRPDGSPFTDPLPPFDKFDGHQPGAGEAAYLVAARWNNRAADEVRSWGFPGCLGIGIPTGGRGVLAGEAELVRVIIAKSDTTTKYRAGVASGGWIPLASIGPEANASARSPGGAPVWFSAPTYAGGDVTLRVIDTMRKSGMRDVQRRLVAVDAQGIDHEADAIDWTSNVGNSATTFRIRGIARDDVTAFRFDTRDFEHVEFRDLPLATGRSNATLTRTADERLSEVRELPILSNATPREVLVNLDDGVVSDCADLLPTATLRQPKLPAFSPAEQKTLREHNAGLFINAGPNDFMVIGLETKAIDDAGAGRDDFVDTATADATFNAVATLDPLQASGFSPFAKLTAAGGRQGFYFRTRSGSIGVMQLVSTSPETPMKDLKLRYRVLMPTR